MESQFKPYSIGYVVEDILEDSLMLKVYPVEKVSAAHNEASYEATVKQDTITRLVPDPTVPGDTNYTDTVKYTTVDKTGKKHVDIISKTNVIVAKWLPIGYSNRLEPPTVCKGETVQLIRLANSDKYYWHTIYNELDLRKLEKATYVYSNKQTIEDPTKLKDVYYHQVDTINKHVKLHTDDSDGEYTTYDIDIDTKNGTLQIIDGKGNEIYLESQANKLTINLDDYILNAATSSTVNTTKSSTNTSKFNVTNTSGELVALLSEFIQAVHDMTGSDAQGGTVPVTGSSQSVFDNIKARVDTFIG